MYCKQIFNNTAPPQVQFLCIILASKTVIRLYIGLPLQCSCIHCILFVIVEIKILKQWLVVVNILILQGSVETQLR